MAYRIISGWYSRRGTNGKRTLYKTGDVIPNLTPAELKALQGQIAPTEVVQTTETPVRKKPGGRTLPVAQAAPEASSEIKDENAPGSSPGASPLTQEAPATEKAKITVAREMNGGWFILSDGTKVHGKAALDKVLQEANGDG